jgi:hypothetical protein
MVGVKCPSPIDGRHAVRGPGPREPLRESLAPLTSEVFGASMTLAEPDHYGVGHPKLADFVPIARGPAYRTPPCGSPVLMT